MTRCQHCEHEFHNVTFRANCPRCGQSLKATEERKREDDSGPDVAGFAVGLMTGLPIGPQGVTAASIAGAMMHSSHSHAAPASDPTPAAPETPSFTPGGGDSGGGGSSGSWDSGSSSDSSSSYSSDSGSSSGGGSSE